MHTIWPEWEKEVTDCFWHPTFSPEWTPEDRLKLVTLMALIIQDDIPAGRYSEFGRPNCQSIVESIHATKEVLDTCRPEIERMITGWHADIRRRTVVLPLPSH